MFWRMTSLATVSPVNTIMERENFTLEDLLDEDDIVQECKNNNVQLINFLKERNQVEQLVRYIVEQAPEDAVRGRTIRFPFIACEIFTTEVDVILRALVEDDELMNLLFSFLEPENHHGTVLAGYFSRVVCLLLKKSAPLMSYIQAHPDIIRKLVDLIGITSIMQVLVRLIGADEYLFNSYPDTMLCLQDIDVLEMILNKFSSSDSSEVHANAAETLCAIVKYSPPGLAAKIHSPGFIPRLFHHAFEESRPKSVLMHSLSVCIYLLDPSKHLSSEYYMYNQQSTDESAIVEGMLGSLGNLLKLLDVTAEENVLPTTFGNLQPPLGIHRLKIVEFIKVLIAIKSEAAEKELIRLGVLKRIIELFFEYPYNNFLHHHVEQMITCCLESKNTSLVEHILEDCNLVRNIIHAERNCALETDQNNAKPTVAAEGKMPPRIGNIGHMIRIANKLVELKEHNTYINTYLQNNREWVEWDADVLQIRNAVGDVHNWECGIPAVDDPVVESDDDEEDDAVFEDTNYDMATLASNLREALRLGLVNNDTSQGQGSGGADDDDDEDMYYDDDDDEYDDESGEAVLSSLGIGVDDEEEEERNANWFKYEADEEASSSTGAAAKSSDDEVKQKDDSAEKKLTDSLTKPEKDDSAGPSGSGTDDLSNSQLEQPSSSNELDTSSQQPKHESDSTDR